MMEATNANEDCVTEKPPLALAEFSGGPCPIIASDQANSFSTSWAGGTSRSTAAKAYWQEVWEVEAVERVLAPLFVALAVASNVALLAHEAQVVWHSQRLIQPKLLAIALCASDLLAVAVGFLPLWILFAGQIHFPCLATPVDAPTSSLLFSPPSTFPWTATVTSQLLELHARGNLSTTYMSSPMPNSSTASSSEKLSQLAAVLNRFSAQPAAYKVRCWPTPTMVHSPAYQAALFFLTAFWTLAQCTVVVMGVERFLALRAPFFYSARCSVFTFLVMLGLLGLLACGTGAFHLLVQLQELRPYVAQHYDDYDLYPASSSTGHPETTRPTQSRSITFKRASVVFAGFLNSHSLAHNVYTLVQGLVWSGVLVLCNWSVRRELRLMEQRVTLVRLKDQGEYMKQLSLVHGAGREFARFMMAVNVVFLLSSYPYLLCVMLRLCQKAPSFSAQYFCWRLSHASALANPFLYGFMRKSLRCRIRRFFSAQKLLCLYTNKVDDQGASSSRGHPQHQRHSEATPRETRLRVDGLDSDGERSSKAPPPPPCPRPSPGSAVMPRDPEASYIDLSDSED